MPLQDHMKLISTDDHVIEHPRVWLDRLPAADADRAPRIVEVARAGTSPAQSWIYEGELHPNIGLNAVAGKPKEEFGVEPTRFDELRPARSTRALRLEDMDIDGVEAALCFPTFPTLRRHRLPREPRQGAGRAVRPRLERLHPRRMVRGGAAAADLTHDPPAVGHRRMRRRDAALHRQGRQGDLVPREPGAARPAVVPHARVGSGLRPRAGGGAPVVHALRVVGSPARDRGRRTQGGLDRAVRVQLDGDDGRPALLTGLPHVRPAEGRPVRGRHRLGALHARAPRLHVGSPPLLHGDRPGHAPVGALRAALLLLLHR